MTDLLSQKALAEEVISKIADVSGGKTKAIFCEHDVTKEDQWISVFEK